MFTPSRFLPPRRALSVPRPAATDAIAQAIADATLTLCVAPGGSGKTTAMAWWAAEVRPRPVVWARFEPQDDDALTVSALLLAALRAALVDSGYLLEQALATGAGSDAHRLAVVTAHDLAAHPDLVLVLDDLHALRAPESLEVLDLLFDNLAPTVRVVAASRSEPELSLARRRVRGELAEVRSNDLRLDASAVRAVLERAGVHDEVLTGRILEYSGGWAAAVHLSVLQAGAARWSPDRLATASAAVPPGTKRAVRDFFADEVLDELGEDLRRFLLQTSLLAELTPESCAVVTGCVDAAALLDEVVRRDLFVTEFDTEPPTLRYHDLFAGFLRDRLASEVQCAELDRLRRLAASCSPTGHALGLLTEAGDEDAAAELVSAAGRAQVAGTGPRVPDSWLGMLSPAARERYPWVGLLAGLECVRRGSMDRACRELAPVLDALRGVGDDRGTIEAEFALLEAHMGLGDIPAAQRVLDGLGQQDLGPDDRIRLLATGMWFSLFAVDWPALSRGAEEAFALAFAHATDVGRRALALSLGTEMLFVEQGPAWLREQCRRLAAAIADPASAAGGALAMMDAAFSFFSGDLDHASVFLAAAVAVSREHGGLGWLDLATDRLRLAVALANGDRPAVESIAAAAAGALGGSAVHHQERAMYAYALARSAMLRDRPAELVAIRDHWLARVDESDRPDAVVTRGVLDAWIARAGGDEPEARRLLEAATEQHRAVRFSLTTGQPLLEWAAVCLDVGDEHAALNLAREALEPIAAMNAPGLLLQEGPGAHRRILEACVAAGIERRLVTGVLEAVTRERPATPTPVPGTGAVLSIREVEVLVRVVAGDSNRAIGEALFIGERTVKTHMTSLMRKLGVSSRTQAVARARELGLST